MAASISAGLDRLQYICFRAMDLGVEVAVGVEDALAGPKARRR